MLRERFGRKPKVKNFPQYKKAVGKEGIISLIAMIAFFGALSWKIGFVPMMQSMFTISYNLLIDVCFYIMAIAVIAGALAGFLTEFGIIALINFILYPLMMPIFGLPGAAAMGILTTFLSDNPAILTLCDDERFRAYFKRYQLPALTNLGTAYGMGLIVIVFVLGLQTMTDERMGLSIGVGLLGAVVGSIVSTRLMLRRTAKLYGKEEWCVPGAQQNQEKEKPMRKVRVGSVPTRLMDALLEGGASGVKVGFSIIPGVLIICTIVMLLTYTPDHPTTPGVGFLPWLGKQLDFILVPLFGFSSPEGLSVPITALGSAGAAIGLLPDLLKEGFINGKDIAVFTSMCMCWSGYLSTHVAMMDSLNSRELTGSAILSHTIGGAAGGIAANWIYQLIQLMM